MTKINVPRVRAEYHPTFTTIFRRMKNHRINLYDHMDKDTLKVFENKLDGIEFKIKGKTNPLKAGDLLSALRSATVSGKRSFRQGMKFDHPHWAVDASMAATKGIGFREITYLDSDSRAPQTLDPSVSLHMRAPKMNSTFSSQFGKNRVKVDISSLHCALWGDFCSIHIDETGFVLQPISGLSSDVIVTPDFLQHTLLELIWKGIPGMPDSVEIYVPNSNNNYSRFGLRGTAELSNNIRLSLNASYNIRGKRGFSKTLTLHGKF